MKHGLVLILLTILSTQPVCAQIRTNNLNTTNDPRGPPELTICSQNLENYGIFTEAAARTPGLTQADLSRKEDALGTRFARANCDVIAVQELLGKTKESAEAGAQQLARLAQKYTGRIFETRVGETNDQVSREAYLVARDRADIVNTLSYARVELPKIAEDKQKPRLFSRGPLEIQLRVNGIEESRERIVSLINLHFKSKAGSSKDPTQLEWETYRMEQAEALRRIVQDRHANAFESAASPLIILGDRNADSQLASAKILTGNLELAAFQGTAACRLGKQGTPLCQAGAAKPQVLFSVLTSDPQTKLLPGTFSYKKEFSWIDDILLPAESLPLAWENPGVAGDFNSGVIYKPTTASDHALVWATLNW